MVELKSVVKCLIFNNFGESGWFASRSPQLHHHHFQGRLLKSKRPFFFVNQTTSELPISTDAAIDCPRLIADACDLG